MKYKNIALILLVPFILFSCNQKEITDNQKPNIIYILADDMGINDLGCYGQELIQTPNLDKMASEGIRFTQHYAGSTVCAPSRGTLMTGLHTGHGYIKGNFAMESEGNLPLPDSSLTVAEILKSQGYKTGMIGKWGLGGPNDEGQPNKQGFDFFYGYLDQRLAHEYYPDHLWRNSDKVILDNQDGKQNEYSHNLFMHEATQFIQENKNEPFFLYLPLTIPHGKYQINNTVPYKDKAWPEREKKYAAMITLMDKDIGHIFSLLDSLGLDKNTIVFFSSDNGGTSALSPFFKSNDPFRGNKGDLYEGGIRAPLIVWWPDKILAGTETDHISAFWDMLPTFAEIAGAEIPRDIDGISFLPTLLNQEQKEHNLLFWSYFNYNYSWKPGVDFPRNNLESQAVRMGNWKAVLNSIDSNPNVKLELYDLSNDISEQNNVAENHPEIIKKIEQIITKEYKDSEFFKNDN